MKLRILPGLFLIFSLVFSSCTKNETPQPDPWITYEQYGSPFAGVPETKDIVMYEINLRAFSPGYNLQGVTERLDSIKKLGINVIWLMPIYPIGQINSVNSPYSVKDYKAVNPEFGTLDDLRNLTDGAHARGIAVILDWVANHTSWDNGWISHKTWYTQDAYGNIIHPAGTNWLDVADLNYDNDTMRLAMIDAMKYWAYEANVDGFRCDYADGVPFDFWKQAWDTIHSIPSRKFILFAEGSRKNHFDAGFDLNFSWEFYGAMKNVYSGQPVSELYDADNNDYNNLPEGKHWLRFTTNHDESAWDATPMTLFRGADGALAASVATIFTGGVPLIYAGQEVGTVSKVPFFSNSVTNWSGNPDMLKAYENMLQFYSRSETARKGINTVYPHNDAVCLKKVLGNEEVLILINLRNRELNFTYSAEFQNTNWQNGISWENVVLGNDTLLEAYQYLILNK